MIMKHRKIHKVTKLIDTWNHVSIYFFNDFQRLTMGEFQHFFEPRKLRVILMKGETKLSGLTEPPLGPAPAPTNMSAAVSSVKEKDPVPNSSKKGDDTYRLFIASL